MEPRGHPDASLSTLFSFLSPKEFHLPPLFLALKQTLNVLPRHSTAPFNKPVPPSHLHDRVARGFTEAKGFADWPHSQRATRAKIIKLTRCRARDTTPLAGIAEESCEDEELHKVVRPCQSQKDLATQIQHGFNPQYRAQQEGQHQGQSKYQSVSRMATVPLRCGPTTN